MTFKSATVRLGHEDVIKAIGEYVARQGWDCGAVTIHCSPHQYNGPDTFEATVEVMPRSAVSQKPITFVGARARCKTCNGLIVFDGKCWNHEGDRKPRHPAVSMDFGRNCESTPPSPPQPAS